MFAAVRPPDPSKRAGSQERPVISAASGVSATRPSRLRARKSVYLSAGERRSSASADRSIGDATRTCASDGKSNYAALVDAQSGQREMLQSFGTWPLELKVPRVQAAGLMQPPVRVLRCSVPLFFRVDLPAFPGPLH